MFNEKHLLKNIEYLKSKGKFRKLPEVNISNDVNVLDFSSNDYLGLSQRYELREAAFEAGKKYGVGSTGSRLLSGNNPLFEEFEAQIAFNKGTEAALIFNSGFQANASALACLLNSRVLGAQPLVFFEKLNIYLFFRVKLIYKVFK